MPPKGGMHILAFSPNLIAEGAEISSRMCYKVSKVENIKETFNIKTRFSELS